MIDKKALANWAKHYAKDRPVFIYDTSTIKSRAKKLATLELPYGFTPRYAIKANNHPKIIHVMQQTGLHFDASSSYEAQELLEQGIAGNLISLSSQQPAHNLSALLSEGVRYVATSMHQLEQFLDCESANGAVGLRVNPGIGSGSSNRTTTGGVNASFGLWHEYVPDALKMANDHNVNIERLHIHVGSGADANKWGEAMDQALAIASAMPAVITLDIGGGFKVRRYGQEPETNMKAVANEFSLKLKAFAHQTGRKIHLEVEPGTWLVAHSGVLIAQIVDIVDTGKSGHTFLKLNTGMNDIIRPSMYGAQHDITVLGDSQDHAEYIVVGHNCETGDILTPAPGNPELLQARRLNKACISDYVVIHDVGAYSRNFSASGYNSFPSAHEVVV